MKILYIECGMGAAGDMLTAALLDLLPDPQSFVERLNALSIPGVQFELNRTVKCGVCGNYVQVTVHGEDENIKDTECQDHSHGHRHSHTSLEEIRHLVRTLGLPEQTTADVIKIYENLAEAESAAHGVPVTEIHFHEVGMMDAVADVTAVCMLMAEIAPDQVIVSPIHVGSGQVRCTHGILPVPVPAVMNLLRHVPIYGGDIRGELCTPTGAALLTYFSTSFGNMPMMRVDQVGYGMGSRDFDMMNGMRVFLGSSET